MVPVVVVEAVVNPRAPPVGVADEGAFAVGDAAQAATRNTLAAARVRARATERREERWCGVAEAARQAWVTPTS